MKRLTFLNILFIFIQISHLSAQKIKIESSSTANQDICLYYFSGSKIDSLGSRINEQGKAELILPTRGYKGMVKLKVNNSNMIDFIAAEPLVQISTIAKEPLTQKNIQFKNSRENIFLNYLFTSQTKNIEKQNWLSYAKEIYPCSHPVVVLATAENKVVADSIDAINRKAKESKLYAAEYYNLAEYINKLNTVILHNKPTEVIAITQFTEENLNVAALYHSGEPWNDMQNMYIQLFNKTSKPTTRQEEYANSILMILNRLTEPYYQAFLASSIIEMQRFGWSDAEKIVLRKIVSRDPDIQLPISSAQRVVGRFRANMMGVAPQLIGLDAQNKKHSGKRIIAFYDSTCNTCVNEMFQLKAIYPTLQKNNIEVIGISADKNNTDFDTYSKKLPWGNNLCDLKGFEGDNFINYGVIGTPAFFMVDDEEHIIRYSSKIVDIISNNEM